MADKKWRRAVVLGGSMAGLLVSRVLSEVYDEVIVVDRDELADLPGHRRGVPQGRHVHGLLARGQQIAEELFPGITAELVASGVVTGDMTGNVRWIMDGEPMGDSHSGLLTVSADRPTLERHVRARVRALANVRFQDRCEATGLRFSPDGGRVTGVRTVDGASRGTTVDADMVVDTMGRGSRTGRWLTEAAGPGRRRNGPGSASCTPPARTASRPIPRPATSPWTSSRRPTIRGAGSAPVSTATAIW
ncbi:FAD-dependent oxidoreductase [Streptomyces indonesiensis]